MSKIKKFLHRNIYPAFFYLLPIKKNKIIFSSYAGKQYSDSPRCISELLYERYPQYDIVWLMNKENINDQIIPSYVRIIENESLKAAYELFTAKFWIDNCRKPLLFRKRKKQIYIQCWHGTPLKLIENDAGNSLGRRYRKYAERDSKNIDVLLSGNRYSTNIFKGAFQYNGLIIERGTPRNDILIKNQLSIKNEMKKKLDIFDKKVILYAPTFRNDKDKNGEFQLNNIDPDYILNKLENKYNKECVLLLRFHPNVSQELNLDEFVEKYKHRVINVSVGWDMQNLICCSDILITDYSSVFFDFALLKKPIFIFALDLKGYLNERGLYFKIEDLPLCVSKTKEELGEHIENNSDESLINRTEMLLEHLGNKEDGCASLNIINYIVDNTKNNLK
ncbi:CDP-glycerol glycerophosphotransferase family protein [Clostridium paraputrificum]|uniref:CDP-glycerol glycerophosphotransferase family protein n=1 Tax=Clostridium paraputrificum TaxID=29363 RepID=UPI00232CB34D|nr:CDP-glycerol glycerophosphotransferase family protein [Clostridium paraputrificum]MDB2106220.1 CDP-glycerol glycerophosphotransferase family protein [Clostridium paraputrificum]MDB2112911.1 CDP-glycerol glycerophosphotransferase family protein [Clostridium paraputrificum]